MVVQLQQTLDAQGRRIIKQLIKQRSDLRLSNRRHDQRDEFIAPVDIYDETGKQLVSAVSVDMSTSGVRLVHKDQSIEAGEYLLAIQQDGDKPTVVRSLLECCYDLGGEWYSSGWRFLSMSRLT